MEKPTTTTTTPESFSLRRFRAAERYRDDLPGDLAPEVVAEMDAAYWDYAAND